MSKKVLPIITGIENPILRKKSKKVGQMTKAVKKLIEKMQATVRYADGAGIAAPQVGENIRVLIANISGTFVAMVDPEILSFSSEEDPAEEGCLSLPGEWGVVIRPRAITVRFLSEKGEQLQMNLEDMDARVVQHEVDHLDGILFPDRIAIQQTLKNTASSELPIKEI